MGGKWLCWKQKGQIKILVVKSTMAKGLRTMADPDLGGEVNDGVVVLISLVPGILPFRDFEISFPDSVGNLNSRSNYWRVWVGL